MTMPTPGEKIKTGLSGARPTITAVLWSGTADVICYSEAILPAALVETTAGRRAVVQLAGNDFEQGCWWDARCVSSRSWGDGDLPDGIASQVDACLSEPMRGGQQDEACRQLAERVRAGLYGVDTPVTRAETDHA